MRRLTRILTTVVTLGILVGGVCAQTLQDGMKAYRRGDYQIAYRIWHELTKQGNPSAMRNLAYLYLNGQGVAKSEAKAAEWYEKVAKTKDGADDDALHLWLGAYHLKAKDEKKALAWFYRSAELGNKQAETFRQGIYAKLFPKAPPGWRADAVTLRKAKAVPDLSSFMGLHYPKVIKREYRAGSKKLILSIEVTMFFKASMVDMVYEDPASLKENQRKTVENMKKSGVRKFQHAGHQGLRAAEFVVLKLSEDLLVDYSAAKKGALEAGDFDAFLNTTDFARIARVLEGHGKAFHDVK